MIRSVLDDCSFDVLKYIDRSKLLLGPAYEPVRSLVQGHLTPYAWRVIKIGNKSKYQCTRCNRLSVCPRKCCPECGAPMTDESGVILKTK